MRVRLFSAWCQYCLEKLAPKTACHIADWLWLMEVIIEEVTTLCWPWGGKFWTHYAFIFNELYFLMFFTFHRVQTVELLINVAESVCFINIGKRTDHDLFPWE